MLNENGIIFSFSLLSIDLWNTSMFNLGQEIAISSIATIGLVEIFLISKSENYLFAFIKNFGVKVIDISD